MLASADPEVIGPRNWWDRARTALETGTTTPSFSEAVSKTAQKLQITGALTARTSATIHQLAQHLADPGVYGAWAELCTRDAVYITALTRVQRETTKTKKTPATARDEVPY